MKKTFYSESFGCRVNEAEREALNRQLLKKGFQYSDDHPSLYFINTCAVTAKAEREARLRVYQIKRKFPHTKIILTGCAATYWQKNQSYKNLPVDLIVDNINKEFLVKIVEKRLLQQPASDLPGRNKKVARLPNQPFSSKFLTSGRLLLKIQDGCHLFCSFCIVPYLRGLPKSKKIKEIIEEINEKKSIKEVILTAINSQAYGKDTGESLVDLLKNIFEKTEVPRVSFGSIHPLSVNDDFLKFYHNNLAKNRLVNFFHLPIQSGSNKILSLMKRGYKKEEIIERVQSINRLNKLALIGTDIIVGFLEETENDFQQTFDLLDTLPIFKFHVFRFSKRKGTAAFYLSKKLKEPDDQTKLKRAKILIELGNKKYQKFLEKMVGRYSLALFLNKKIEDYQEALLQNQVPIYIKTEKNLSREIKPVKIIEFKKGKLFGKIV